MLRFDEIRFPSRTYFLAILLLSTFLCLWKLGSDPIHQWDEARYGENAYWMLQKGDFVNFYYEGKLDTWNAKPPLTAWLISLNYRLFGFNEWALRLHSALAGILFFVVFFKLLELYKPPIFAFISSLILLSVKGIIGHHVARTGDTDALLVLFLFTSLYFALQYIDFDRHWAIIPSFIALGLAFYAKGFTFIFYLPGLFIYLLLRKGLVPLFKEWRFWVGIGVLLVIIFSWYGLVKTYGVSFEDDRYPGNNSWEVMIFYDVLARFTESGVEGTQNTADYLFLFSALDAKFNLWNYVMFLGVLIASVKMYFKRGNLKRWFMHPENHIYVLSLCIMITFGGLLTVSKSKLVWYIAPFVPFCAILCTWGIAKAVRWKNVFGYFFLGLILFSLGRQIYSINQVEENEGTLIRIHQKELSESQTLWLYHPHLQHVRLYADWYNGNVQYTEHPLTTIRNNPGDVIIGNFSLLDSKDEDKLKCEGKVCLYVGEIFAVD